MAYQGVMDDIRACVALKKPRRIPVLPMSEEFDVKWYGKYTYEEMIQSADKLVEVWSAAVREFDYDWAWLQIDDCIEFEVLGVGCVGEGNILRATHDYLPATRETLKSLRAAGSRPRRAHADQAGGAAPAEGRIRRYRVRCGQQCRTLFFRRPIVRP